VPGASIQPRPGSIPRLNTTSDDNADFRWAALAVKLGTVPDWLAAIGTIATLSVALAVLIRELREQRTRQAGLVAAWIGEHLEVVVQNKSNAPAYNLSVSFFDPPAYEGHPSLVYQTHCLPPDTRSATGESVPARMGHLPLLIVEFTDSQGIHWIREGAVLRRIRSRSPYTVEADGVPVSPNLLRWTSRQWRRLLRADPNRRKSDD
jgi:hypothetical protein